MQKQAAALSYDFMSKDSSRGSNNKPKTSNSPFETGSPVVTLSSQSEKASKQSETNPRANSAKTPEEQQQHQDQHEDLPQINAQNIQNKLYEALSSAESASPDVAKLGKRRFSAEDTSVSKKVRRSGKSGMSIMSPFATHGGSSDFLSPPILM